MRHRLPYWQAITELKLKKETSAGGEPYASIEFSLVGSLSEDDGAVIRRELTGPIQETVARDAVNEAVTAPSSENEEQQPDEALDAKKEATEAS
jgi:hypothetical protein